MIDPMIAMLFVMEFISLMLAVILVTAWHSFGRPRHALTWGAAFGIASFAWAGQIALTGGQAGNGLLDYGVRLLSMMMWSTMLIGFRQRRGLPSLGGLPLVVGAGALAALTIAAVQGSANVTSAIALLFAAAMMAMSASTMMFRADRGPAECAVITMLLAFAMLHFTAGTLAFAPPAAGDGGLALFRGLMMLTLPSAFTGTGLFVMFLLAADLAERMGRLAALDPLTGVLNRRGFEQAAARAIANARRQGQPLTVVVADIDRFKDINDRFGHAFGDRALCRFTDHIAGAIRSGDLLGRIGGEEFGLVLVDADASIAVEAIDRIRMALGQVEIDGASMPVRITASFGVTGTCGGDDTLPEMLARADQALYRSKISGRNRVTLSAPAAPQEERREWRDSHRVESSPVASW
ncbi:MAG: diguanylate cyclase [Sphingomonas bacterium]|nr:diguanylate cyclase [Sphingomonas bacterium]